LVNDRIQIIAVEGIPLVKPGDDIAEQIHDAAEKQGTPIQNGDVLVITQSIISKAEGAIIQLDSVTPSEFSKSIAEELHKDPRLVEIILRQAKGIARMGNGHLITETKHGWICANSGVDISNFSGGGGVTVFPPDIDESASRIRRRIHELSGINVAVIISDTVGRPFREGQINLCIGCSGIKPIFDRRGERDLFGYVLRVKLIAVADELASAAELVIGQADEGVPVAIVRGYNYQKSEAAKATDMIMPKEKNLFL
jgi:coenzyme F420-0:L-glutamate ligase/coenzyme F420-1:gamma-L-glutamate ligase